MTDVAEQETASRPRARAALLPMAAVAISSVGVLVGVSVWVVWLVVLPQENAALMAQLIDLIRLVLAAVWFAVLPAGLLGMLFGITARDHPEQGLLARAGAYLGLLALVVALSGVIVFLFVPTVVGAPVVPLFGATAS